MLFFRKYRSATPEKLPPANATLSSLVREHMAGADEDDVRVAAAIAGLFAVVAYADREYVESERAQIREDLARMPMFEPAAVAAICALLDQHIVELATGNTQTHTRDLRELLELPGRREVLHVLVDLAAADGTLDHSEADTLRRLTSALGLTPDDYMQAQDRHRERLSSIQ